MIGSGSGKEGGVTGSSGEKWIFVTFHDMHSLDLGFQSHQNSFPISFPVSMYFCFCISNLNHYGIIDYELNSRQAINIWRLSEVTIYQWLLTY